MDLAQELLSLALETSIDDPHDASLWPQVEIVNGDALSLFVRALRAPCSEGVAVWGLGALAAMLVNRVKNLYVYVLCSLLYLSAIYIILLLHTHTYIYTHK